MQVRYFSPNSISLLRHVIIRRGPNQDYWTTVRQPGPPLHSCVPPPHCNAEGDPDEACAPPEAGSLPPCRSCGSCGFGIASSAAAVVRGQRSPLSAAADASNSARNLVAEVPFCSAAVAPAQPPTSGLQVVFDGDLEAQGSSYMDLGEAKV